MVDYHKAGPFASVQHQDPVMAVWNGSGWDDEKIEDVIPDAISFRVNRDVRYWINNPDPAHEDPDPDVPLDRWPPEARDVNLQVPRSVLALRPDGRARFAYARPTGGVFLATRRTVGVWQHDQLEVTPSPGPSLGLALDGEGVARVAYADREVPSLRFFDEENDRKLVSETPAPQCTSGDYVRRDFVTRFPQFLDQHDDYRFTADTLVNFATVNQTDLFASAIRSNVVRMRMSRDVDDDNVGREDFVLIASNPQPVPTATIPPPLTAIDITRFEFTNFPFSAPTQTRARIRFQPMPPEGFTGFFDTLVEVSTADTGTASSASCCRCPANDPDCCDTPDSCNSDVMTCTPSATPILDCFGFPVSVNLTNLGGTIRGLSTTLPLIEADPDDNEIDEGTFEAEIDYVSMELQGLTAFAEGDGRSSGTIGLDFPLNRFRFHIVVFKLDLGDPVGDLTGLCDGRFDIGARVSDAGAMHQVLRGKPVFVSKNSSARFGTPATAHPIGKGDVSDSDINLDPPSDNVCEQILNPFSARVRAQVGRSLRRQSPGVGGGVSDALVGPMLEHSLLPLFPLPPAPQYDAREGVVLFVNEADELTAVFEGPP